MSMLHFNMFDYIILGIVGLSTLVGIFRGFIRESISLLTWVFAFIAALKFSEDASSVFARLIANQNIRYAVTFITIFIIVLIVGVIVNKLVSNLLDAAGFGFFDHLLGLLFGAARGIVLVTIIVFAIKASANEDLNWYKQSQIAPKFAPLVNYAETYLPTEIKKVSTWLNGKATVSDNATSDGN